MQSLENPKNPPQQRAAFSPAEFAALFNRNKTWTYRLLYAGKVKALTKLGRILIPASELERVLAPVETYNPKPKKPKAVAGVAKQLPNKV